MRIRPVVSLIAAGAILAAIIWSLGAFPSQDPRPAPFSMDTFSTIQVGMTRAAVERLMNCPPEDYASRQRAYVGRGGASADIDVKRNILTWSSDECLIHVSLDETDVVVRKELLVALPPLSAFQRLKVWLSELLFG